MSELRDYLAQMAKLRRTMVPASLPYAGLEDFVLSEGESFKPTPYEPGIRLGTPKQCFSNAAHYALEHFSFRYCEGFFFSTKLPIAIHHAWVVGKDGFALDVTIPWHPETQFYGVIFEDCDLSRRLLKQKVYGLFDAGYGYTDLVMGTDPTFNYRRQAA